MSCEWPVDRGCLPDLPTLPDDPTEAQQAEYDAVKLSQDSAIDMAIGILWALSGRQYGVCPAAARPCPPVDLRVSNLYLPTAVPFWDGDYWSNASCGCLGGSCVQSAPSRVHLPGPVQAITSVRIGGVELNASEYVVEGDALIRTGGRAWPGQNITVPADAPGGWIVEYTKGVPVPAGVPTLVGQLAAEIVKACGDGGKCRIPRNVVAVTRQGVSYQVYDPQTIYAAGKTGLPEIDLWLASVNPHHLLQGPSVV
ncbi:head-to-tail adaptor [Gordonia phage Evaa]|nr:head-to-tail adaptor [Gordonia phage Evaa]